MIVDCYHHIHHHHCDIILASPFPKDPCIELCLLQHNIVCFNLLLSVLIYETAIVRRDMEAAADAFEAIPSDYHDKLSRFLEAQGLLEDALRVTTDPEHQFELAIQLNKLPVIFSSHPYHYHQTLNSNKFIFLSHICSLRGSSRLRTNLQSNGSRWVTRPWLQWICRLPASVSNAPTTSAHCSCSPPL